MVVHTFDELINAFRECNTKKYIWGIGLYGNLLGIYLNSNNIQWDGYYDNFEADGNKCKNGKMIYGSDDVIPEENAIYFLSMRNYQAVLEQLVSLGIKEENILAIDEISLFDNIDTVIIGNNYNSDIIKEFHNKHEGESCFVIGNGPSLRIDDLEQIYKKGYCSFATNYIFNLYNKTSWRPNFYCCVDPEGIEEIFTEENLYYISNNCEYIFSRLNGKLRNETDKVDNIRLLKSVYSPDERNFSFAEDCSEKIYIGYTVTFFMLQLAVYMGFKNIYLIGIDHSFAVESVDGKVVYKDVMNYSKDLEMSDTKGLIPIDKTTLAYISARKYAEEHGINIFNTTRGGKLEVFERKNLDDILFNDGEVN